MEHRIAKSLKDRGPVAQWLEQRAVTREVVISCRTNTQGLKITEEKVLPKTGGPVSQLFTKKLTLWDVQEPLGT